MRSVRFGSFFRKPMSEIFIGLRTPLVQRSDIPSLVSDEIVNLTVNETVVSSDDFSVESDKVSIDVGVSKCGNEFV